MKKLLISFILVGTGSLVYSQTDIQLSHQIYNRILFNPAATGQSGCYNVSLLAREQWTGISDAPSTQILNANKYFTSPKLGIGLMVINDKLGVEKSLNVKAAIAYHAWLSDKAVLSFGLGLGFINRSFDGTGLIYEDPNDPNAVITKEKKFSPDFDFGVEFNAGGLNLGVSATHLVTSLKKSTILKVPRHIYAYAKYAFKVSDGVEIIPAISFTNISNISILEINATTEIRDRVWVGASYRVNDAFVLMAGVKIIDQLRLGYAYDFKMGSIKSSVTEGSHEIMLIGRFGCKEAFPNMISPRFFN